MAKKEEWEASLAENLTCLQKEARDAMLSAGLTPAYWANKLKEEAEATEVKAAYCRKEKEWVYSEPLIAWEVRQRARMDAQKLFNLYPAEKTELTGKNGGPIEITGVRELISGKLARLTPRIDAGDTEGTE